MILLHLWQVSQSLCSKSGGGHAHLYGRFTHSIECVTTCFSRRALVNEITENGCCSEYRKVNIIERLYEKS